MTKRWRKNLWVVKLFLLRLPLGAMLEEGYRIDLVGYDSYTYS